MSDLNRYALVGVPVRYCDYWTFESPLSLNRGCSECKHCLLKNTCGQCGQTKDIAATEVQNGSVRGGRVIAFCSRCQPCVPHNPFKFPSTRDHRRVMFTSKGEVFLGVTCEPWVPKQGDIERNVFCP